MVEQNTVVKRGTVKKAKQNSRGYVLVVESSKTFRRWMAVGIELVFQEAEVNNIKVISVETSNEALEIFDNGKYKPLLAIIVGESVRGYKPNGPEFVKQILKENYNGPIIVGSLGNTMPVQLIASGATDFCRRDKVSQIVQELNLGNDG